MFSDKKSPDSKKASRSRSKPAAGSSAARSSSTEARVSAAPATEEQIRARAYQLFVERGYQGGNAEQDWLRAEAEVRGGNLTYKL